MKPLSTCISIWHSCVVTLQGGGHVDLRTSVTLNFTLGRVTHTPLLRCLISPKESLDILGFTFPTLRMYICLGFFRNRSSVCWKRNNDSQHCLHTYHVLPALLTTCMCDERSFHFLNPFHRSNIWPLQIGWRSRHAVDTTHALPIFPSPWLLQCSWPDSNCLRSFSVETFFSHICRRM